MSYKNDLKLVESVIDTKADMGKLSEANKALVRLEALVKAADKKLKEWDDELADVKEADKEYAKLEKEDPSPKFVEAFDMFQPMTEEEQKIAFFMILDCQDDAREKDSENEETYKKALEDHDEARINNLMNRHYGFKYEFAILNYFQSAFMKNPEWAKEINNDLRVFWFKTASKQFDSFKKKQETKKA